MEHGGLLFGSIILELLPEFLHLKEHCFGLIGNRRSEEGNGLNDVVDNIFEFLSWFNCCVGSHMSISGDSRR